MTAETTIDRHRQRTTSTSSAPASSAVAAGDLAGFAAMFHPDATWNHRNDDRLGGVNQASTGSSRSSSSRCS